MDKYDTSSTVAQVTFSVMPLSLCLSARFLFFMISLASNIVLVLAIICIESKYFNIVFFDFLVFHTLKFGLPHLTSMLNLFIPCLPELTSKM